MGTALVELTIKTIIHMKYAMLIQFIAFALLFFFLNKLTIIHKIMYSIV